VKSSQSAKKIEKIGKKICDFERAISSERKKIFF